MSAFRRPSKGKAPGARAAGCGQESVVPALMDVANAMVSLSTPFHPEPPAQLAASVCLAQPAPPAQLAASVHLAQPAASVYLAPPAPPAQLAASMYLAQPAASVYLAPLAASVSLAPPVVKAFVDRRQLVTRPVPRYPSLGTPSRSKTPTQLRGGCV